MNSTNLFICPMHPEIQKQGPGSCSICGMDLEPKSPSQDHSEDPEKNPYQKRFFISLALTLPVFLDAMFGVFPPALSRLSQLVLSTGVVLWGGWPFFVRAWDSVKNIRPNMFTLIALGTGTAYLFSVVSTLAPNLFPAVLKTHQGLPPIYFEAAAVITTLVLLGQYLETQARKKTSEAIQALLSLNPQEALLLKEDGNEQTVPICHIKVGDRLRVKPGEKIPTDGIILDGRSQVDESMMTGEAEPVIKKMNDWVTGGTLNTTGSFVMKAERVGDQTLLSQIVQMVSEAQRTQAPVQKLADKVSGYFVPGVIVSSLLTFVAWNLFGSDHKVALGFVNSISVLIIACPCALGLATPMSMMVGIGRAAKEGILIKNAQILETLGKIQTIVFDKTGTLTEGISTLGSIHIEPAFEKDKVFQWVASLENNSEHPLAKSILQEAKKQNLPLVEVQKFRAFPGKGVVGTIDGKTIVIGNEGLFRERLIPLGNLPEKAADSMKKGLSISFISIQNKPAGFLGVSDAIKETSHQALEALKKSKLELQMLTGDKKESAKKIADQLGLTSVVAEVRPTEKGKIIKELQASGRTVAMAGDGINDAPALAQADVGIAMGTGTDVAIQSADVTLMNGNLVGVSKAYRLSQLTLKNIRQNLFFAFAYNLLGVPIAAGVLYPFFGILLSPMIAGAAMSFSSVSIIWNSLRLRKINL